MEPKNQNVPNINAQIQNMSMGQRSQMCQDPTSLSRFKEGDVQILVGKAEESIYHIPSYSFILIQGKI